MKCANCGYETTFNETTKEYVRLGAEHVEQKREQDRNTLRVRLDVRTSNPLNGSQGITRGAMWRRAAGRKKLRAWSAHLCTAQIGSTTWMAEPGLTPLVVKLTRIAPRQLDQHDGLGAALKPIIDGVADYLGVKDNDPRITWKLEQRKGRVREYAVEIQIRGGKHE